MPPNRRGIHHIGERPIPGMSNTITSRSCSASMNGKTSSRFAPMPLNSSRGMPPRALRIATLSITPSTSMYSIFGGLVDPLFTSLPVAVMCWRELYRYSASRVCMDHTRFSAAAKRQRECEPQRSPAHQAQSLAQFSGLQSCRERHGAEDFAPHDEGRSFAFDSGDRHQLLAVRSIDLHAVGVCRRDTSADARTARGLDRRRDELR